MTTTPSSKITRMRLMALTAACAASALALVGCSGAADLSQAANGSTSAPHAVSTHQAAGAATSVPAFSGPWAEQLDSRYRNAGSDFERSALADGRITDAEFAQTKDRLSTCFSDHGITFRGFDAVGALQYKLGTGMSSGRGNQVVTECSASSGENSIGFLYFQMKRNPENLANDLIISRCMVANGAVPVSYSAKDYDRDAPGATFPYTNPRRGPEIFKECSEDPLGLLGSE